MAETSVYSIRIDPRIRILMDEMKDEDWQAEIRNLIEAFVRRRRKEELLHQSEEICSLMNHGPDAYTLIREDRDV